MSLEAASWWSDLASWVVIAAAIVTAVGTWMVTGTASVKETHWEQERQASRERVAQLETEAARLSAEANASREAIAAADLKAAQAAERAAQLTAENLKMQAVIAPRTVAPFQIPQNATILQFNSATIKVSSFGGDAGSAILATQFIKILQEMNFIIQDDRMSQAPFGVVSFGVHVSGHNNLLVGALLELFQFLNIASIMSPPPTVPFSVMKMDRPDADAIVFVGIKPLPGMSMVRP
ncbi:MAG: hypothetical protein NTY94_23485 [Alphaproteobacteria bacterium]|nr:hypothetical protein [Alphaproteobacteria bacterium]